MNVSIKKEYKSIKAPKEFDLPNLVVLTGKNGSGKSHLMEALSNTEYVTISDDGKLLSNIRYIEFNGLNPKVISDCQYLNLTNQKKEEWNKLCEQINNYKNNILFKNWTIERFISNNSERKRLLGHWAEKVNGDLEKLTEEFFSENYEISSNEMFSSQFATIFKLYQIRLVENKFNKFLNETEGGHYKVLTDDEFERAYGPKPWELINKMLMRAHLTYQVNHPEGNNKELDFHLCLKDINTGTEIQVNDLSTGEKVLMSLALSIYNSKEEMARPDVLLLDEPDAPLHPEFTKVLLSAINDSIVKEAGVKVIMSTHSPTTVALAPEDSLYLMNKEKSLPEKISKQRAVSILVQDLDNIRLSYEQRRQVFVESKYDVQYYSRLFSLIETQMPTSPQFLPPRSSDGSNCDEVSDIVNALRTFGNDLVFGIKDFDNKNHSSQYVFVLGENNRYAIDNYIFDPIYVAFLLIRENIIKTDEADADLPSLNYVELSKLNNDQIQKLINYVLTSLELSSNNMVEYYTQGGQCFRISKEYCLTQGHTLESKILRKWQKLKSIAKGGGDNKLKNHVLETVCKDYPAFIANDFVVLFKKIV